MKKVIFNACLLVGIFLGGSLAASAQHYVKVRPRATVVVRPARPHANNIWIGPEWQWQNGSYTQVPGYWTAPVAGKRWVPGRWVSSRRGNEWIAGHWQVVRRRR